MITTMTRRRLMAGALCAGASLGVPLTLPSPDAPPRIPGVSGARRQSDTGSRLSITDVTVIDATGAPPRPRMTVSIEGERIAAIAPTAATEVPSDVHAVSGAGQFLIPGLWDAHVHTFVFPWQPDVYLPLLVANGVTGVRDMGGTFPMDAIDEVRAAIGAGERVGPRVVAGRMVDGPTPVWPFALPAGTAEEARQAVAAITESGADFVKVYTLLPRVAFFAVADAASERGLPFAGHVPIAVTAAEASDAGQRSVEHFSDSLLPYCATDDAILAELRAAAESPEPVQAYAAAFFGALPRMLETFDPGKTAALAERFAANGAFFTPTLIIGQNAALAREPEQLADPRLRHLPPEVVAAWMPPGEGTPAAGAAVDRATARRALEVGAEMTLAMQRAGASVLAGTDLGLPFVLPGFSLHDELGLLVEAGLSPLEALQAATRDAAAAVGRDDDLGTVEVSKLADLVLLDADPLADIANTTRIAAVVANGRLLAGPGLEALLAHAAPAATPAATPAS